MRGMCVEGKCRAVGPNGILGLDLTPRFHQSTAKNLHIGELCSACEDANSKCILMSFIFTQPQMSPGYTLIATIPKGACYVNITQLRPTRNHLALRNPDGSYVFNGNWAINKNGIYDAAGTKFYYNRPDNLTLLESITSVGPLMNPIDIMLVYRVPNPGVKYEYKIASKSALMSEKIAPPSIDLRRLDHRPSTLSSQADEAVTLPRHNHRIMKNRRKKYSWKISPSRTPCSKSCGGGFQSQIVVCVRESTQIPVHERRCIHSDKPTVLPVRCATQPCPAHWITTWSPCSVTCGQGEQTRLTFECKQEISHKISIMVNEGACMEPKPPLRKACFVRDCDETGTTVSPDDDEIASNDLNQDNNKYQQAFWRTGPWSQCSSTCGNGYRTRSVICHGHMIRADDCPIQQRPNIRERCENLPPCNTDYETTTQIRTNLLTSSHTIHNVTSSSWLYTEWSQNCDDDCGTGSQYRRVACLRNDDTCADTLKPEIQRSCTSDRHCGGKWYTGPWGRCIEPCGVNPIQKREVLCVIHVKGQSRIVNEKTCPITTRPITEKPCEDVHCPSQWYTSDWGVCSNPVNSNNCENAIQRRDVRCLDANQHDANNCDNEATPPMKRSCEPAHCSNRDLSNLNRAAPGDQPALDGGCVDKIDRCRTAVQARLCQYEYYQTKCCLSCSRAPELPRD
ncbi:ADAMTS-like protein 4 isoform X2 [Chrysoperla carnea]|uniref:ADAMTS-like protein 4 isoform X2 n=1 Tax=Chrysoperla carnea TaxID=189513 RepID=UPI001D07B001|nr:ADAMTS-like protein 4 isoform X2 [Chrysoperla carnea]